MANKQRFEFFNPKRLVINLIIVQFWFNSGFFNQRFRWKSIVVSASTLDFRDVSHGSWVTLGHLDTLIFCRGQFINQLWHMLLSKIGIDRCRIQDSRIWRINPPNGSQIVTMVSKLFNWGWFQFVGTQDHTEY